MTVDFCGVELDVEFDREPMEPENDLWGRVENARAFYNDCEVTDILHALDKYLYLKELIEEKL